MAEQSRRAFTFRTLLASCVGAITVPSLARAMYFDRARKDPFLNRDDIDAAVKSYYQTYNCTKPYPHKFNEVFAKTQLRSLQFYMDKGMEKAYVEHYLTTMAPWLDRIKQQVAEAGPEKALEELFEKNPSAYQLFERIEVKPGERCFPCPYKELLGYCKKYLNTFTIQWEDVHKNWCIPTWAGCGERIGVPITVSPGEICSVSIKKPQAPAADSTANR